MEFEAVQLWSLLAGLGLFLFGMFMMEESLKTLAGRSFKKFLRKHTTNAIKAVLSGTLVTAILQSSSMVSLLVMSFAGAGIIGLKNGIGMIMGANLGTTLTGWLVSLIGFKLDIETLYYHF
jgi:phosphate:Na+ symporter